MKVLLNLCRVLIGIAAIACLENSPHAADLASLKGPWIGTQEDHPLKLALIVEYLQPDRSGAFTGDARYGFTGYSSANLSLGVMTLEGKTEGGSVRLVGKA